jgi:hypothetical protein
MWKRVLVLSLVLVFALGISAQAAPMNTTLSGTGVSILTLIVLAASVVVYVLAAVLLLRKGRSKGTQPQAGALDLACRITGLLCLLFGVADAVFYLLPILRFLFP